MGRNGKPPTGGVPEHDVAGPMLIVIDTHAARDDLQILNPAVAGISTHFGDEFRRIRHDHMVSRAVPHTRREGTGGGGNVDKFAEV